MGPEWRAKWRTTYLSHSSFDVSLRVRGRQWCLPNLGKLRCHKQRTLALDVNAVAAILCIQRFTEFLHEGLVPQRKQTRRNYEFSDLDGGGLQLPKHTIAYLGTTVKRQKRILQSCSTAANIDNATTLVLNHFGKHCTSHPAGGADIHLKHGFDIVIGKFLHVQEESGTKFITAQHTG